MASAMQHRRLMAFSMSITSSHWLSSSFAVHVSLASRPSAGGVRSSVQFAGKSASWAAPASRSTTPAYRSKGDASGEPDRAISELIAPAGVVEPSSASTACRTFQVSYGISCVFSGRSVIFTLLRVGCDISRQTRSVTFTASGECDRSCLTGNVTPHCVDDIVAQLRSLLQ